MNIQAQSNDALYSRHCLGSERRTAKRANWDLRVDRSAYVSGHQRGVVPCGGARLESLESRTQL